MKITATDLDGLLQPSSIVLVDELQGDVLVDPMPLLNTSRLAQHDPIPDATFQFSRGRGNRLTNFQFTVERAHASQNAAATFIWSHDAAVPVNCKLTVTDDAGLDHVFKSAIVVGVRFIQWENVKTVCEYQIEGAQT